MREFLQSKGRRMRSWGKKEALFQKVYSKGYILFVFKFISCLYEIISFSGGGLLCEDL